MAEENKQAEQTEEIDYKAKYEEAVANSRKWEKRSKENAAKAQQFDQLAQASKSVEERVAALEAENQRLTQERERMLMVKQVASASGVPENIVATLRGSDEDELLAQAQAISAAYKLSGAPNAPEAGIFPREQQGTKTTAQMFADIVNESLSH